jgi:hypothetical protein
MILPPDISLILAIVGVCLRLLAGLLGLPVLERISDFVLAGAIISFGVYIILLLLLPDDPRKRNVHYVLYLRAVFTEWQSGMSGALSVPFTAAAIWWTHRNERLIWIALAIASTLYASYRVWRRERLTRYHQIAELQSRLRVEAHDAALHVNKEEIR